MARLSDLLGGGGGGGVPLAATAFAKPSIILFETRPGTRDWIVPDGVTKIRAFVVGAGGEATGGFLRAGAGGGYSEKIYDVTPGATIDYTVGEAPGGTSSFAGPGGTITATGGESGGSTAAVGGSGSGGDINTSGGGALASSAKAGGSAGNRFGNGLLAPEATGAGWGDGGTGGAAGGSGGIDGFGLGCVPGHQKRATTNGVHHQADFYGYGCGGAPNSNGGIGGGGGSGACGGIGGGGGGGGTGLGGFGLVGVEWLE